MSLMTLTSRQPAVDKKQTNGYFRATAINENYAQEGGSKRNDIVARHKAFKMF